MDLASGLAAHWLVARTNSSAAQTIPNGKSAVVILTRSFISREDSTLECWGSAAMSYLDEKAFRYLRMDAVLGPIGRWSGVLALTTLASCGYSLPPVFVTEAGNCVYFGDESADPYTSYLAEVRKVANCQSEDLRQCTPSIKLEFVDYPRHISRKQFEDPNYLTTDYPRARLRTTSLVGHDVWLSQRFIEEPWDANGYEVRFRDGSGARLTSKFDFVAMRDIRHDCNDIVLLSPGNYVDIDIPLVGVGLTELKGDVLIVRAGYFARPSSIPKALPGTFPSLGLAVSNPIAIAVD